MAREINNLRSQTPAEWRSVLAESHNELQRVSFKVRLGEQKNVRAARRLKKRIARLLTLLAATAKQK